MFDDDDRPFVGDVLHLERPLNRPQPVRRPPIMVGGGGERKTLRLVAQYADACNLFATGLGPEGSVEQAVERLGRLGDAGIDHVILGMANDTDPAAYGLLADVVAQIA